VSLPSQFSLTICKNPSAKETVNNLLNIHKELIDNINIANQTYSKYYNKKHLPDPNFNIGSKVWLSTKYVNSNRPMGKLDYKNYGPFKIKNKIGRCSYELELPPQIKKHPVFHVSLLEPVKENTIPGRYQLPPPPIIINDNEEFEVEEILDSRIFRNKLEYYIDWKGYGIDDRTWVPISNISNAQELLNEFHLKNPNKPKPLRVQYKGRSYCQGLNLCLND